MMGWSENFIAVLLSIVAVALMAVSGSLWRDGGPVLVEHAAKISPAPGRILGVVPTGSMMYISGMPTERGAK